MAKVLRLQMLEKLPGDTSICNTLTQNSWASFFLVLHIFIFSCLSSFSVIHLWLSYERLSWQIESKDSTQNWKSWGHHCRHLIATCCLTLILQTFFEVNRSLYTIYVLIRSTSIHRMLRCIVAYIHPRFWWWILRWTTIQVKKKLWKMNS